MSINSSLRKKPTLRDVARHADVSVATVSRVMNAPGVVSRETRTRVEQAIEQLGFMPSAAARAVSTGRTKTVGALVPTLDHAIFARFIDGLEDRLAQAGLSLVVATTDDDQVVEARKGRALFDIGVEGLIVSGVTHAPELARLVERSALPTVATSYFADDYHLPTIGYDNAAAAELALGHLEELGHKHIAVLHGPTSVNDRTRARLRTVSDHGCFDRVDRYERLISIDQGCEALRDILSDTKVPSAVLCFSDVLAAGVLFEAHRQGLSVPADLSVMGMEDLPSSAHTFPRLTSVHLPVAEMGVAAASAMIEWLETRQEPRSVNLPITLNVRESTGPVR